MIQLYVKTGCPFCAKVIAALDAYTVPYTQKNIAEPEVVNELISVGGKKQTPFLIDDGMKLYESDAIVSYIEKTYGVGEKEVKPTIHIAKGSDVCPS
jgi:glutaredoxin 3